MQVYRQVVMIKCCDFSTWGNSLLGGRIHLAESLDLYSLKDLIELENNHLLNQLRNATQKLITHVLKCPVCSLKGSICEYCKDPQVIFPFQLQATVQCKDCKSLYHSHCYNEVQCPVCIKTRLEVVSRIKIQ
jgi:hypothetical protein